MKKQKLISLAEYARQRGRRPDVARHMAQRGGFKTAVKIGRDWLIDPGEEWPDRRVTTGKYRDKNARIRERYQAQKEANSSEKTVT